MIVSTVKITSPNCQCTYSTIPRKRITQPLRKLQRMTYHVDACTQRVPIFNIYREIVDAIVTTSFLETFYYFIWLIVRQPDAQIVDRKVD